MTLGGVWSLRSGKRWMRTTSSGLKFHDKGMVVTRQRHDKLGCRTHEWGEERRWPGKGFMPPFSRSVNENFIIDIDRHSQVHETFTRMTLSMSV